MKYCDDLFIVKCLKHYKNTQNVSETARKFGISKQLLFQWGSKAGIVIRKNHDWLKIKELLTKD